MPARDRWEAALAIAATPPEEAGLQQAFPAGSFDQVHYDGFGWHGQFTVTLLDASALNAPAGMTVDEARLAIRAAVCTTQNGSDSRVNFFLDTKPAPRLFGQPLTDGMVRDADCPPEVRPSRSPQLVPDGQSPIPLDLLRLAKAFLRYAVGASDSFPHWESVSMSLGGQAVVSIDDVAAALSNREMWRICPGDWQTFGAASCPVDLLAPIHQAVANDVPIAYSAQYGEVTCAPRRSGPPPTGRMVVLRPTSEWRTCASDFALTLVADDHGLLRSIDLALSNP
ncbi:hypothetical protein [Nocardioides sp. 616]|uniref:hypothetical protein n=1 Tax=Nocardioides sp. 616 TaxID=2268090 RepID=UPI0013B3608B|nr:hypothetical protein [Nocardioides sp. 616]